MEEDIKVLEELKGKYITSGLYQIGTFELTEDEIQAIEHLIARNKELEEENKSLTDSYLIQKDLINEEILRERKQFYEGELYTAKQLKNIERDRNKYYIPKSKVRELYNHYKDTGYYELESVLEELLQEGDK